MDYTRSAQVRAKSLTELMFEQDRTFGEAISDKFKARAMGFKEKFTPLNIVRMLTGSGGIGRSIRTVAGRAMGYSERDIQHFGGYKRKRSIYGPDRSRVPAGSKTPVKVNDSTADILAKIYNLMRKIDEDNTRRYEKEQNFTEETQLEDKKRHNKVLDALGAKNKGTTTKPVTEKKEEEKDEKGGILTKIFSSIFGIFDKVFSFFKVIGKAIVSILEVAGVISALAFIGKIFKNPLSILQHIIVSILPSMLSLIFAALKSPMTLLAVGAAIAVTDAIRKLTYENKDAELLKAKSTLPGPQSVQSSQPDDDTMKALKDPLNGFTTETEVNANRKPWDKKNQKLYDVPIIGSGGKNMRIALTHTEAKQLAEMYENVKNANSEYEERKTVGNYDDLVKSHNDLNGFLTNYFKRTYHTPNAEVLNFLKESTKGLKGSQSIFESILDNETLKKIGYEVASDATKKIDKTGLFGTKEQRESAGKAYDKAIDAIKDLNKLRPSFDFKNLPSIEDEKEKLRKDLEELSLNNQSKVINLSQPMEQKIDIASVWIRDPKLQFG